MNVIDMNKFEKGQFQAVLDKGTLDSILCDENAIPEGYKYLREIIKFYRKKVYLFALFMEIKNTEENFYESRVVY